MAISDQKVVAGVVRLEWDDETEQVREFSAARALVSTRAYTPAEKDAKTERTTRAQQISQYATVKTAIQSGIAQLQQDRVALAAAAAATDAQILSAPAAYIKGIADRQVRLTDATIGLARIVADAL